jgi:hypothetical protein
MAHRFPEHTPNADTTTETFEVSACVGCVMETEGYDRGDDLYTICPEWDGYELVIKMADDALEPVEAHFSWGECEVCHTTLGGDRYDAEMVYIGSTQQSESVIHSASQTQIDRRS